MMKIIKQGIIPFAFVVVLLILIFQIAFKTAKSEIKPQKAAETEYSIETFRVGEIGWGYNIFKDKKLVIKQDIIPAIEKQVPFQSEKDAREIAHLVVNKLNQKKLPTVALEELDSLQVVILQTERQ